MRRIAAFGVFLTAVVLLASCGGDSSDQPLRPGPKQPVTPKQATLSRAEYPPMRDFLATEPDGAAELRPVCNRMRRAPDTAVIRAARNACDRSLSVYTEVDSVNEDVEPACRRALFDACADGLVALRRRFAALRRIGVAYDDDISAAVASGPCRDALQEKDELEEFDRFLRAFDEAERELRRNNPEPLRKLDTDSDSGRDDPIPCRPR